MPNEGGGGGSSTMSNDYTQAEAAGSSEQTVRASAFCISLC